jgi:hypothetical protein
MGRGHRRTHRRKEVRGWVIGSGGMGELARAAQDQSEHDDKGKALEHDAREPPSGGLRRPGHCRRWARRPASWR